MRIQTGASTDERESPPPSKAAPAAQAIVRRRISWGARGAPLALASLPMLLFFAVPLLALVLRIAPSDLLATLVERQVAQAIQVSATTTLATTGLTVVFGAPLAYLLARRRFWGRAALESLLDLPMLLPPAVAGVALLLTFGRRGLLGGALSVFGLQIAFTQVAVVLAQLFVAAPFFLKAATTAFAGVDRDLEQAAAVDGASPFAVFRHITLPLCASALFGGAVMTWARALGEFGATILFAGNFPGRTQTMPLAIYIGFEVDLRIAITLAVTLLVVSFATLFLVRGTLRRRIEPLP